MSDEIVRQQAAEDQRKAKHYQAWQAINLAHGLVGNCGRYDALLDLHQDGVSLVGVNLAGAVINGISLTNVDLYHADISDTLISGADLRRANLAFAKAERAELAGAKLQNVDFTLADLTGASLVGADVTGANFDGAILAKAELRDLKNWQSIASMNGADITGVRDAPKEFVEWALKKGAIADDGKGTTSKTPDSGSKNGSGKGQTGRDQVKNKYVKDHPGLAFTNDIAAPATQPDSGSQANSKANSARDKIRAQYLNRNTSRAFTNDLAPPH